MILVSLLAVCSNKNNYVLTHWIKENIACINRYDWQLKQTETIPIILTNKDYKRVIQIPEFDHNEAS